MIRVEFLGWKNAFFRQLVLWYRLTIGVEYGIHGGKHITKELLMAGVNKAILVGNLGRDPELRYTPSGVAVASFSLATTERISTKDGSRQDKTEWHNIVVFGRQAELVNQYLKKGRSVYLEGRIQTRSWDDRDGNKRNRTEIVANVVQFLDSRDSGRGAPSEPREAAPSVSEAPSSSAGSASDDMGGAPPEDDLPF